MAAAAAAPQPRERTDAELLKRLAPKEYVERLLATRGQAHDERRTVTILFADVKGSTAMAEKLDPEDVKEVMHGAFEVLIPPIYRYEGTLVQLMGDAILAFFGAPIAHEDDPERACRAGLEITAEAQRYAEKLEREKGIAGFAVRVGINTGLVVVGEVGTDLRVAYTAMGDTINLAARMEQNAAPGTVLITENTFKLVAPLFETQVVGPLQLKGKAEPVLAYRVLAARPSQAKVRGIAGLESPLVGREAECAALQEALQRLRSGVGGIVTIAGDAGLGKSRLVAEMRKQSHVIASRLPAAKQSPASIGADCFAEQAARNDNQAQWVEGRCLSYGTSIAYLLWLDVLRNLLGVTVEDSPQQVLDRLRERVQALCGEAAARHFPYLARLLSLPLDTETDSRLRDEDGQQLKSHTFEAVDALLCCAASERPLVLVCEDLHWADPTSLELLERVLTLTDRASLLLILVFRPDPAHGSWQLRETIRRSYRHRHTDLELRPLSAADSQTLVGNLLQVEDLPADLRQRIIAVAEGNPFFVEEVLRGLIDSGAISRDEATRRWLATRAVGDIVIPDTLQGVLLARLDRLEEDTKRILQMAAVIGRVFLYRVLGAIAAEQRDLDGHLLTLQRQEMIRERARLPELEYIFKHELTREAAYNGILKAERRAFHQQVAEALERLFPERIDEQLGLLAHHWERAGDADKATDYLLRAGDQARLLYAHPEAIDCYRRALALLQTAGNTDQAARVWMKLGQTYHSAFDFEQAREAYAMGSSLRQESRRRSERSRLAPPRAPTTYRCVGVGFSLDAFDPALTGLVGEADCVQQLFSGLVELSAELDVVPDVAQSWDIQEEGRRYIFHLCDDILWSDGRPVTAADFEYAWKRVLDPQGKWPTAALFYDLKNARAFHQGQVSDPQVVGVRAADARTLVVELERPTGYLLNLLTNAATCPVPQHVVEAHPTDWATPGHLVSNGPFLLRSFHPGESFSMERNPHYGGAFSGNVERVDITLLPVEALSQSSVLVEMYEADRVDMLGVGYLLNEEIQALRLRHLNELVSAPYLGNAFLAFVVSRAPFDDVRVRRAFVMATDRRKVPWVAAGLAAAATGGFVPEGMPGHCPGIALPFDPQAARALLAEAGYPLGRGFPLVRLLGGEGVHRGLCQSLQLQWRENLGIETHWEAQIPIGPAVAERVREGTLHMFINGWLADYPDPDNFLRLGIPFAGDWRNEAYEGLVEEARRSTDQGERMRLYRRAERILVDEAPFVPLSYERDHVLVKPWVRMPLSASGRLAIKDIIIEPHQEVSGQRVAPAQPAARPAPNACRLAWIGEPPVTFDPGMASEGGSQALIRELFGGLLEVTPDLDLLPDVAKEWEVLDGGRRYVFHLRDDVRWSDGTPVTAHDFEYAWKRVLHPATSSVNAALLYDIKNARAFHQGQVTDAAQVGVSAPDPHTLLVELEAPTGHFLNLLACTATFPVPRHAVEAHGQDWAQPQRIISNGAFLLQTLRAGDLMALELNPRYHGRRGGNVGRIEFRFLPASAWHVARDMYAADELDVLDLGVELGSEEARTRQRFAADYAWARQLSTYYLEFIANRPPFDDVRVRRAFAMAVDRQGLPTVASGSATLAAGGFVPPGMPGHSPGISLPYDPEGARRLLAEAGYPRGQGLPVLDLLGWGGRTDVAEYLQAQWRQELNAETRFDAPDPFYPAIAERLRTDSLHMFLLSWSADYPDPANFLSDSMPGTRRRWGSEAYERLLESARRCMDQAERMKLYREADKMLVQEAIVVPLSHGRQQALVKPWVKVHPSPLGVILGKDVIIEPH